MLITYVASERASRAHGIQCGMALISMLASTGSPSNPASRSVFKDETEWS